MLNIDALTLETILIELESEALPTADHIDHELAELEG